MTAPWPGVPAPGPLGRTAQVVAVEVRAVQAGERGGLRLVQGAAVQPADRAAAGRCRRGSSVNSREQFARYRSE